MADQASHKASKVYGVVSKRNRCAVCDCKQRLSEWCRICDRPLCRSCKFHCCPRYVGFVSESESSSSDDEVFGLAPAPYDIDEYGSFENRPSDGMVLTGLQNLLYARRGASQAFSAPSLDPISSTDEDPMHF